jgi:hypothetical protein
MRTGLISFLVFVVLLAAGAPAKAQWIYKGEKSEFGGVGNHIAATANGGYFFGFRCEADGPIAVYGTPESMSDDVAYSTALLTPQLLMKIDSNAGHEVETTLDTANENLRANSSIRRPLLEEVASAKGRVNVALRLGKEIIHEHSFNTRGSTKAVSQFLENCPSVEPAN